MRIVFGSAILVVFAAFSGTASAHGGGSFVSAAHMPVMHSAHYKTTYRASIVVTGAAASGIAYHDSVSEITVFAVPTEAQRYMNATGHALPAKHSNILLPPATPTGDYTYIWTTSSAE